MATTTFTDQQTPVVAAWLNDVDALAYQGTLPSTATGVPFRNKNMLLNGAFDVWQRGTSIGTSASFAYIADRWYCGSSGGSRLFTRQTGPTGFTYCIRAQRTAADANTTAVIVMQHLESINSLQAKGQQVTLSFYARAGANFSSASNLLSAYIRTGTGTDQKATSYTGSADTTTNVTLTTSWKLFTLTGTLSASLNELAVFFQYNPVGAAGAADYYEVSGVQLEISPVASSFDFVPFEQTYQRCLRYYQKSFTYSAVPAQAYGNAGSLGWNNSVAGAVATYSPSTHFKTPMRITPAVTFYNPIVANAFAYNLDTGTSATATVVSGLTSSDTLHVSLTGLAGWGVGNLVEVQWAADAEL